jgi:phosphoglycolate phosphatase-like HAD superfamily hydrolase
MHANKSKSIYIGDMASDIITAQLADIASCGVAGGVGTYVNLKEAGPNYLFESVEEIERTLKLKFDASSSYERI